MAGRCELCGKPLTVWNRCIGRPRCASCQYGVDPDALSDGERRLRSSFLGRIPLEGQPAYLSLAGGEAGAATGLSAALSVAVLAFVLLVTWPWATSIDQPMYLARLHPALVGWCTMLGAALMGRTRSPRATQWVVLWLGWSVGFWVAVVWGVWHTPWPLSVRSLPSLAGSALGGCLAGAVSGWVLLLLSMPAIRRSVARAFDEWRRESDCA